MTTEPTETDRPTTTTTMFDLVKLLAVQADTVRLVLDRLDRLEAKLDASTDKQPSE